jgi:hypothetical protein
MKRAILKTLVLLLVTGVLLISVTSAVSASEDFSASCKCASQTWFLDSEDDSPVPGTRVMYKAASSVN